MVTESINKKERTITLQTDYEFKNFKIQKWREHFHFSFIKDPSRSMGMRLFFNRFNGRKYYPKEITVGKIDIENKIVELIYK